jgi:lysophospholipase L1-like esterase
MRTTFFFAALLVIVALAALFVEHRRDATTSAAVTRGTATLVGDSLNVGVEPYLPAALPHWTIVTNDRVGRTTAEGIDELEAGRAPLSPYVVVSLGTNDSADGAESFRADVARVLKLIGPNRCVIWATIWRNGKPNDAFNGVLRDAADANQRVRLVEWAAMVQAHPDWLAGDRLHGNETGYRERARAVAAATRSCAPAVNLTSQ